VSTFAISDIHGENKQFKALLNKLNFRKKDKLYLLGDYIDRGPDGKEVLDTLFDLIANGYDVHCLRGNHEQLLLDARTDTYSEVVWLKNGGNTTLSSFLTHQIDRIPDRYFQFIESLPYCFEHENYLLVHAGIDMSVEEPLANTNAMLWLRDGKEKLDTTWLNGRVVVHGHTPMKQTYLSSKHNLLGPLVCIDNGAHMKGATELGSLCAYDLELKELIIL